jgi:vancomycin resistance protein YoaR
MGHSTERDSAPEPNRTPASGGTPVPGADDSDRSAPGPVTKPAPTVSQAPDAPQNPDGDETPYTPPVRAYERPQPSPSVVRAAGGAPTQALPIVVGHVATPTSQPEPEAVRVSRAGAAPEPEPDAAREPEVGALPEPTADPTPESAFVPRFAFAPDAVRHPDVSSAPKPTPGLALTEPVPVMPPAPAARAAQPQVPLGVVGPPPSGPTIADPLDGLVGDGQPSRAPRVLLAAGGVVVVLAGLYTGAQALYADKVPSGTHVAGVDVGGLSSDDATKALTDALAPRAREPIQVTAGEAHTTLDPAAAGLSFDAAATVAQLTGFSMNPARLWEHVFGGDDAAPHVALDRATFNEAVGAMAEGLAVPAVDGTVGFTDGAAVATPAADGTSVPAAAAGDVIRKQWLVRTDPIELPTEPVAPAVTQAQTDAALAQAQQIVAAPVTVNVGGQHAELPAATLAAAASFQPVDGSLQVAFDGAALVEDVVTRTNGLLTDPHDAHFEFQDGRPVVVGGEPGTTIDPAALGTAVQTAALGTDRTAAVELTERDPEQTKAALEQLGVTEVVSEFSTPLTNEAIRTQNLRRGAELVTGTLIRPGETFSLIDALSPIDASNGFRSAGVINNGVHTEGMGGGLSQMATTTYNAGFFAGFEDVEHRPHSVHFGRYPAGREATIFVGSLDMRFKNNSPYGAVMQAWVGGGQLHVQLWSTKYFRVETTAGERRNVVPTSPIHRSGADCARYPGGEDGFTITNTRKVFDPSNTVVIDESKTWTYRPDNPVVCDDATPPAADTPSDTEE